VEIDFNLREPWTGVNAISGVLADMYGTMGRAAIFAAQAQNEQDGVNGLKPGFTFRDQILARASLDRTLHIPRPIEGFRTTKTYAEIGVPKWQGTLEENALMMRRVLTGFGAYLFGFAEIDDNSVGPRRRLFMPKGIQFDDLEDFTTVDNIPVIPNKCNSVITIYTGQRADYPRTRVASPQNFHFNRESYEWTTQIQNFLWGLGYQAYDIGGKTQIPPWAILSGMGEYNRTHNPPGTPEGTVGNGGSMLLTDLPLPPTKPIDFGMLKFCETCSVCAEACPVGSIPLKEDVKEPTWERAMGPWSSSNDHKGYPNDGPKCAEWFLAGCGVGFVNRPIGACSICSTRCVFNHENDAWIHQMVHATLATTPMFNTFFYEMDKIAGYHDLPTDEEREAIWTAYPSVWG
jgi:reductive dehalogenase